MDDPVDLVSIRVVARVDRPALSSRLAAGSDAAADGRRETRRAYFGPTVGLVDVPVTGRAALDGAVLEGPLFVDEYDSTTVIPPGCRATLDPFGSIDIDVD